VLDHVINESFVLVGPAARKKGLMIDVSQPDAPIRLATDVRKLRQIIVNLLANAIHFTEQGEVVVRATTTTHGALTTVRLAISDTGCGIASADHERIFDAFWQANSGHARAARGTGLGLSVARQYARLLGGDVCVTASTPGEGSVFELAFPAIYTAPVTPKAADRASHARFIAPEAA
jgi:signal transduction histidine kinase